MRVVGVVGRTESSVVDTEEGPGGDEAHLPGGVAGHPAEVLDVVVLTEQTGVPERKKEREKERRKEREKERRKEREKERRTERMTERKKEGHTFVY